MAQEFTPLPVSPEPAPPPKKNNNTLIIVIVVVVVVLLCCCCLSLVLAWNYGDQFLRALGLASLPVRYSALLL